MSARIHMVPKPFAPEDLNWHACYDLSHSANADVYTNNAQMDFLYDSSGNGNDALRAEAKSDEIIYVTSGDVNSKPCFRVQNPTTPGDSWIGYGFQFSLAVDIVNYSVVAILDTPTLVGDGTVSGYFWYCERDNTGTAGGGTGTYTERGRVLDGSVDNSKFYHVYYYADDDLVTPNHGIRSEVSSEYAVGTYGMTWRLLDTDVSLKHNGSSIMSFTDRVVDTTQAWDTSTSWGALSNNTNQAMWPCDVAFFGIYNGDIEADPKWPQFQNYISNEYGVTI